MMDRHYCIICLVADGPGLEHVYTGVKMNDLKPLYGAMLADVLAPYTHWGWIDIDCLFGDLSPLLVALRDYDVVAYPDGVSVHDT